VTHGSLFVHRDFRLLLVGQTTSQLGTQISAVAIPLLAVATLQATSFEVGLINAASTLAFGQIVYAITNVSVRQWLCPDRMLGRVNATMQVFIMGLFPLGAIVGGVLWELIGARLTLVVAGLVMLTCPIILRGALGRVREVETIPAWATPGT
jgi:hypothetical protein